MQRYVFHLYNLCFAEHKVPRIWKLSNIKPLYKGKGSKAEPNSYRGISLLSSCTNCSRVSSTSVCEYGSSEIKFYHQFNMVSGANCPQSTQFCTRKKQSSKTSAAMANTMPASLTTKKLSIW